MITRGNKKVTAGIKTLENQLNKPAFVFQDTTAAITLQDIVNKYNWRNAWSPENVVINGDGTVTAVDYMGIDNLTSPSVASTPTLSEINGKSAVAYDGVDDYLVKNVSNWRGSDSEGQLIAVIKTGSDVTSFNVIFSSGKDGSWGTRVFLSYRDSKFRFGIIDGTINPDFYGNTIISPNSIYIVSFKNDGASFSMTVNGIEQTLTFNTGNDGGYWMNIIPSGRDHISSGVGLYGSNIYREMSVGFVGYAPSTEATADIIEDLNKYYKVF